jgi:hypothetical protein
MHLPDAVIEQIKHAPKWADPEQARELDLNGTSLTTGVIIEIRYYQEHFGTRVMPRGGWRPEHQLRFATRPSSEE